MFERSEAHGAWWFSRASNPLRVAERRSGWVRFPHASATYQRDGELKVATVRIAAVQMDCKISDVSGNREKILSYIRRSAERSAKLVIFPECALTGYCFDSLAEAAPYAETLDGPTSQALAAACHETGVYTVAGFIEREDSRFYNAAMLVGPNGVVGSYRKVHLPFLGIDRFLTPGDRPFSVFDLPIGRIGINICYDLSFPEAARALKLLGAELILLPTAWPPGAWRSPQFVVNTRAQENHVNFIAVNRVGEERGWRFIGRSKFVDFNGDTVEEAGDLEQFIIADLNLNEANNNRIVAKPGEYEIDRIADRRPDFYEIVAWTPEKARSAD